jgi:hypothetical protein
MTSTTAPEAPVEAVALATRAEPPARHMTILTPVAAPKLLIEAQQQTIAFVRQVLKVGRDYGTIPGTKTPTLLKPGSEKVLIGFGCVAVPEIVSATEDHDRPVTWEKKQKRWNNAHKGDKTFEWDVVRGESLGLYSYTVRVKLIRADSGEIVGEGLGICSTLEAKYVDRPRECQNTVLKMAKKRAQIDATLTVFGLSDEFTQDMEDTVAVVEVPVASAAQRQLFAVLAGLPGWTQTQRDWWRARAEDAGDDAEAMQKVCDKLVAEVEKRGFLTGEPERDTDAEDAKAEAE